MDSLVFASKDSWEMAQDEWHCLLSSSGPQDKRGGLAEYGQI